MKTRGGVGHERRGQGKGGGKSKPAVHGRRPVIFDHVRKSEELLHSVRWGRPMQEAAQEQYQEHAREEYLKHKEAESAAQQVSNIKKVLHIASAINEEADLGVPTPNQSPGAPLQVMTSRSDKLVVPPALAPAADDGKGGTPVMRFSMKMDMDAPAAPDKSLPPPLDARAAAAKAVLRAEGMEAADELAAPPLLSVRKMAGAGGSPERPRMRSRSKSGKKINESLDQIILKKGSPLGQARGERPRNRSSLAEELDQMVPIGDENEQKKNMRMSLATQNIAQLMQGRTGAEGRAPGSDRELDEESEMQETTAHIPLGGLSGKMQSTDRMASMEIKKTTGLADVAELAIERERRRREETKEAHFRRSMSKRLLMDEEEVGKTHSPSLENSIFSTESRIRSRRRIQRAISMAEMATKTQAQTKGLTRAYTTSGGSISRNPSHLLAGPDTMGKKSNLQNALREAETLAKGSSNQKFNDPTAIAERAKKKNASFGRTKKQVNEYNPGTEIYYGSTICLQARHGGHLCFDTRRRCRAAAAVRAPNALFTIWNLGDLTSNGIVKYGDSVWLQAGQHEVLATAVVDQRVPYREGEEGAWMAAAAGPGAAEAAPAAAAAGPGGEGGAGGGGGGGSGGGGAVAAAAQGQARLPVAVNFRGVNKVKAKATGRWTMHANGDPQAMLGKEVCHLEEVVVMQEWAYLASGQSAQTILVGKPAFEAPGQGGQRAARGGGGKGESGGGGGSAGTKPASSGGGGGGGGPMAQEEGDLSVHRDGVWVIKLVELPLEAQRRENQRYKLDYQARQQLRESRRERETHFAALVRDLRADKDDMLAERDEGAAREEGARLAHLRGAFRRRFRREAARGFVDAQARFDARGLAEVYGPGSAWARALAAEEEAARKRGERRTQAQSKKAVPALAAARAEYAAAALGAKVKVNVWTAMEELESSSALALVLRRKWAASRIQRCVRAFLQSKWETKFLQADRAVVAQMGRAAQRAAEQGARVRRAQEELQKKMAGEQRAQGQRQKAARERAHTNLSLPSRAKSFRGGAAAAGKGAAGGRADGSFAGLSGRRGAAGGEGGEAAPPAPAARGGQPLARVGLRALRTSSRRVLIVDGEGNRAASRANSRGTSRKGSMNTMLNTTYKSFTGELTLPTALQDEHPRDMDGTFASGRHNQNATPQMTVTGFSTALVTHLTPTDFTERDDGDAGEASGRGGGGGGGGGPRGVPAQGPPSSPGLPRPQSTSSYMEKSAALRRDPSLGGRVLRPQSAVDRMGKKLGLLSTSRSEKVLVGLGGGGLAPQPRLRQQSESNTAAAGRRSGGLPPAGAGARKWQRPHTAHSPESSKKSLLQTPPGDMERANQQRPHTSDGSVASLNAGARSSQLLKEGSGFDTAPAEGKAGYAAAMGFGDPEEEEEGEEDDELAAAAARALLYGTSSSPMASAAAGPRDNPHAMLPASRSGLGRPMGTFLGVGPRPTSAAAAAGAAGAGARARGGRGLAGGPRPAFAGGEGNHLRALVGSGKGGGGALKYPASPMLSSPGGEQIPETLNDAERLSLLQSIKPEVFGKYTSLMGNKRSGHRAQKPPHSHSAAGRKNNGASPPLTTSAREGQRKPMGGQ